MKTEHSQDFSGVSDDQTRRLLNTMESGRVTRYHAVPTVAPQSLGLHQWGVAILCLYLTGGEASGPLLREALMHDTAEFFTGDVPFTVKRDRKDIKKIFEELEEGHRARDLVEVYGSPDLAGWKRPDEQLTPQDKALLKLADTLEGLLWCFRTEALGPVKDRWLDAYKAAIEKFTSLLPEISVRRAKALVNCLYPHRINNA